jgi:1,4-dihydroxy-2-naphthoate octaprenyltransferase
MMDVSTGQAWVICVGMVCVCVMIIWTVGQFR